MDKSSPCNAMIRWFVTFAWIRSAMRVHRLRDQGNQRTTHPFAPLPLSRVIVVLTDETWTLDSPANKTTCLVGVPPKHERMQRFDCWNGAHARGTGHHVEVHKT